MSVDEGSNRVPAEPDVSLLDPKPDHTLLNTFQIKPSLEDKVKPQQLRELIYDVLQTMLVDRTYPEAEDDRKELVKGLAVRIKQRCRDLELAKYKVVVNVVLGEQRGAGVSCVSRCFWDADTDSCASNTFVNDSIFCMAAIFGVYFY